MEKNIEGDKYLDYSGETLEQWQNFRAVSLRCFCLHRMAGFRQLMMNSIVGKNREDKFAVTVYGDTQSSTCMYSA